jgi:hypothetical protein
LWKVDGVDFPTYLAALRLARLEYFNKRLRDDRLNGRTCFPAIDWVESTHKQLSAFLAQVMQPIKSGTRASNLRIILKEGGISWDDIYQVAEVVSVFENKLENAMPLLKRKRQQPELKWKKRANTNLRKAGIPVRYIKEPLILFSRPDLLQRRNQQFNPPNFLH